MAVLRAADLYLKVQGLQAPMNHESFVARRARELAERNAAQRGLNDERQPSRWCQGSASLIARKPTHADLGHVLGVEHCRARRPSGEPWTAPSTPRHSAVIPHLA